MVFMRPETLHIDRVRWSRDNTLELYSHGTEQCCVILPHTTPSFHNESRHRNTGHDYYTILINFPSHSTPYNSYGRNAYCPDVSAVVLLGQFREGSATFRSPVVGICAAKIKIRKFTFCSRSAFAYFVQSLNKKWLFPYTALTAPYNESRLRYLCGTK